MPRRLAPAILTTLTFAGLCICAGGCASSEMSVWAQTSPGMMPDEANAMNDIVLLSAQRAQPEHDSTLDTESSDH